MKRTLARAVDRVVSLESAILERPARSPREVGAPILVASHRRSGTHLTIDTLRHNFPECRASLLPLESLHRSYLNLDRFEPEHPSPISEPEALRALSKAARPTLKSHAWPGFTETAPRHATFVNELLERAHTLYVVRNPVRVMVSCWIFYRTFLERARVPFAEFLRQRDERDRSRPRAWAEHVRAWRERPDTTTLKFEDLTQEPRREIERIADACRLRIDSRTRSSRRRSEPTPR